MPRTASLFTYYPSITSNHLTIHSQKYACLHDKLLLSFQSYMCTMKVPQGPQRRIWGKRWFKEGRLWPFTWCSWINVIHWASAGDFFWRTSSDANRNTNGKSLNGFKHTMTMLRWIDDLDWKIGHRPSWYLCRLWSRIGWSTKETVQLSNGSMKEALNKIMRSREICEKFQNWHDVLINFQDWGERCGWVTDDSHVNIHH